METLDAHNLPGPAGIFTDKYIRSHWSEFSEYLDSLYPKEYSLREKLWLYSNNQSERPRCPSCGTELRFLSFSKGYQVFCCMKCRCNSPEYIAKKSGPRKNGKSIIEKTRKTNLERYGVENVFQAAHIKDKIKKSLKEKYGVEHPLQNTELLNKSKDTYKRHCEEDASFREAIDKKIKETNKKREITCNERYGGVGFGSDTLNKKTRKVLNERYGTPNFTTTSEYKTKSYLSRKQHNTFNSSSVEAEFANWLNENNIKFIRQYKSDVYPYPCDFYFPDKDLYFEINGNWTHGKHPFNPESPDDMNILNLWKSKNTKYYDIAISVWTKTDPKKI